MSSSLRSQPPAGNLGPYGARDGFPEKYNWTEFNRGDWAIQVCEDNNKPVRIMHSPCYNANKAFMWWGPIRENSRQRCWSCNEEIGKAEEEFLLKAWELYVL